MTEILKRWFWATTYTEYFTGMSPSRPAKALGHVRELAFSGFASMPPGMSREVRPLLRFDFRGARSRGFSVMLGRIQVNVSKEMNSLQILADYGADAVPMLLPAREVRDASAWGPENRFLVYPATASLIRQTLRNPGVLGIPESSPFQIHAIDVAAGEALWQGDFVKFLRHRRHTLTNFEREEVESVGLIYAA